LQDPVLNGSSDIAVSDTLCYVATTDCVLGCGGHKWNNVYLIFFGKKQTFGSKAERGEMEKQMAC
jgi:hypothetical protein